jgi:glycosyltransferase involved in cell wall biosynthesis
LPVAEALAAGAPVVTSAGTATEELVAGGVGLLADPRDPDAIAGAIAAVLDDDDLADRLRRAARKRAAETTWATTAALTIAAYEEVAGG